MGSINVAILQMISNNVVESNIEQIESLLLKVEGSCQIVFLPENALFFRTNEKIKMDYFEEKSIVFEKIANLAKLNQIAIHIGSVPVISEDGEKYSSSVLFLPDGSFEIVYSKMHLFDVNINGRFTVKESDFFSSGKKANIFKFNNIKFGSSICYDIRFSALFDLYAKEKVDCILIPASFLTETGKAHWHILNRARAIETQSFIISAAQAGTHIDSEGNSKETYGHSLIIDPWGKILAEGSSNKAEVLNVEIDLDQLLAVRSQIPICEHRLESYSLF